VTVNPWWAFALVVVATALSDLLIVWAHRRETNHAIGRRTLAVVTMWFLISFAVMAFLVIPH
jgi:hypothetical protein